MNSEASAAFDYVAFVLAVKSLLGDSATASPQLQLVVDVIVNKMKVVMVQELLIYVHIFWRRLFCAVVRTAGGPAVVSV